MPMSRAAIRAILPPKPTATAPWTTPPPPLATNARNAERTGICVHCQCLITYGARVADLPDGRIVHVPCVGRLGDRRG